MVIGRIINKFINIFTTLFGIATVLLLLLLAINNASPIHFLGGVAEALTEIKNYLALATVFCSALEFTLKRNIILAIIFAVILAGTVALLMYTEFAI